MIDDVFLKSCDDVARKEMTEAVLSTGKVNCQQIGRSIMGRSIELYRIGNGRGRVIYFGAHHALESITCNLLFTFLYELATGSVNTYGRDLKTLLNRYTYFVVPTVNPDGIDMRYHGVGTSPIADRQINMSSGDFGTWQANARGVDLNHNYNSGFAEYKAKEAEMGILPGRSLYSGEYPESEPESRAAANLVRSVAPVGIISLHSQGEEIFYSPKNAPVERIACRLSAFTAYKVAFPCGTAAFGALCDFTGALGIPSYTFEVGKGKNPLPEADIPRIYPRISGALLLFPTML